MDCSQIGDFGMSRELMDNPYYCMSEEFLIPVKWTAPEVVSQQKFSSASDVWSYGFVLYELWSIGEEPYPKHSTLEVGIYTETYMVVSVAYQSL